MKAEDIKRLYGVSPKLHESIEHTLQQLDNTSVERYKKRKTIRRFIIAFDFVCEMPLEDINKRRAIINILVHSVYLYDDHFTLIINASKKPMSIDNIPLEEIEEAFSSDKTYNEQCSTMTLPAPPE